MTETENLWPTAFKIDVQSPLAILKAQAALLGKVTSGLLQGTVETETTEKAAQHRLVVIAPAYNHYRHVLLVAKHDASLPYPTTVVSDALARTERRENELFGIVPSYVTVYPVAHSDDELIELIREALASSHTKAVVLSLIAKSNEATAVTSQPSENAPEATPTRPSEG